MLLAAALAVVVCGAMRVRSLALTGEGQTHTAIVDDLAALCDRRAAGQ